MDESRMLHALAAERLRKARMLGVAHGMAADWADALNKWLGVPVVILTSLVGTSVFASLLDLGKSQVAVAIVTAVLSVLAAVLAAVQTFFNFASSAQAHAKASNRFQSIASTLEHLRFYDTDAVRLSLQAIEKQISDA
jgi:hypothetical protein